MLFKNLDKGKKVSSNKKKIEIIFPDNNEEFIFNPINKTLQLISILNSLMFRVKDFDS